MMRLLERTCLAGLLTCGLAQADPVDLKPFRATYSIEWKGITAGTSTFELKAAGADSYSYSSVNVARGVFRLAFSDAITQASTFRVVDGRVLPISFRGSDEKERPTELTFDWDRKRVTGTAKGHAVDLELPEGALDPMSLQIASLRNLAGAKLEPAVHLVDSDKIKDYELHLEGNAQIETALGTLDTVIYTSRNSSGDRITRTWVAPALGYLPVKAERVRGNKVEFTLLIQGN
jgi:Protein of unknown function (DUF3108)